jgi:hypothetical protein
MRAFLRKTCQVGKLDPRDFPKYMPSPQWLITTFLEASADSAEYMQLWMATIGARIIKLDHTFKAASKVRGRSGEQQWGAIFTVMNEYCQILAQFACPTKSLAEVQGEVASLFQRMQALELQVCPS